MNPHFFFKGKLSREEAASAFLATMLECRADFRSFVFGTLEQIEPHGMCRVTIEEREVDVRLEYPTEKVVVLIENKVRPGSLQVNQLVRYYESELRRSPDSRILSILVGPTEGTGTIEVARLTAHHQFRPMDSVHMVSWRSLAQFCDILSRDDLDREFVQGGFDCVFKIIEDAVEKKYLLLGGRKIAHEIAQNVLQALKRDFPSIRFGFWRAKDLFNIYTIATDVTVYVDLAFRIENRPPYTVLDIHDRQHVAATLRTQCALSAKGKKNAATRQKWESLLENATAAIPEIGQYKREGRWFRREITAAGDATSLEEQLADMGRSLITGLRDFLRSG